MDRWIIHDVLQNEKDFQLNCLKKTLLTLQQKRLAAGTERCLRSEVGSSTYKQLTHLFNWQVVFLNNSMEKNEQSAICCNMNVFLRTNNIILKWRCQHVCATFMALKKIKFLTIRLKRSCSSHMRALFDQLSTVFFSSLKLRIKGSKLFIFSSHRSMTHYFSQYSI